METICRFKADFNMIYQYVCCRIEIRFFCAVLLCFNKILLVPLIPKGLLLHLFPTHLIFAFLHERSK